MDFDELYLLIERLDNDKSYKVLIKRLEKYKLTDI